MSKKNRRSSGSAINISKLAWEDLPEYRMQKKQEDIGATWVGFELDGVLAHYEMFAGVGVIGSRIDSMILRMQNLVSRGVLVRIFSSRIYPILYANLNGTCTTASTDMAALRNPSIEVEAIRKWSRSLFGFPVGITCVKDSGCVVLYDWQSIRVEKNTGVVFDDYLFMDIKHQESSIRTPDSDGAQAATIEESASHTEVDVQSGDENGREESRGSDQTLQGDVHV